MKEKKSVYYAHSKKIYNTDREKQELKFLRRKFDEVTCPNNNIGELGSMWQYLKMVRSVNLTVFSEYKKHIGKGVYEEIIEAFINGKQVLRLRKILGKFKLTPIKREQVEIADPYDWKVEYARIKEA